jgi:flagellar biosynthetic protein FliQ
VGVAMFVGVGIAFVQALTQVQEMTLTFVPKIVAILITVAVSAPFVGAQISTFTNIVFQRIETGFYFWVIQCTRLRAAGFFPALQ